MNTTQASLLVLLKSAVMQLPQPLPDGFSMEEVLTLSKPHHVVTMVYEGALLCGISPADPAMRALFPKYCKALQISALQMRDVERLCRTFDENGIDYMPLKGCIMKALYPKPELRMMGDADILIRTEQYGDIIPLMQSLQFTQQRESDHELIWVSNGLYLELHKRLIPSYNDDFYGYFGEGWQRAEAVSGNRYAMSVEDELIFQFTHFTKHYRDGGIGCRHIVDLWVYRNAHPELDTVYLEQQLEKLNLLTFYRNICRLIAVWFEGAASDEKTEYISNFILSGGSWGTEESRAISRTVRYAAKSNRGVNGRLLYLWRLAFPGVETLRDKYRVLYKCPFLLPLVWLWRPFYKILFERKSLESQKRRIEAVTSEGLDDRRKALRYVGLDTDL